MVAKEAVSLSRANGLAAALGMGLGGTVFALAALAGLQAVLLAVPILYSTLKVLGGLYLCYLGYRIYTGAKRPLATTDDRGTVGRAVRSSLWFGLTTQLSNPKTAIVYPSVFAAFLPTHLSAPLAVALVALFSPSRHVGTPLSRCCSRRPLRVERTLGAKRSWTGSPG
jgi:threonine/homoserine/homoserine lactone efflux protein